jgi:hypothetical protein
VLMERISAYVVDHPGLSKRSVLTAVHGDDKGKSLAFDLLVADNYVQVVKGARGAFMCSSSRPFTAKDRSNNGNEVEEEEF